MGWLERRCQGRENLEVDGPTLRLVSERDREGGRERGTMDDGGWKKERPKVPGRTQRRSFPVFPHFKLSSRLHLPGGTILIRKLAKSLRTMGTIVGKEKSGRGPAGGDIEDVRIAGR